MKNDHSGPESTSKSKIVMPFASSFCLHRDVICTKDDRLLLNGYGLKEGKSKLVSFVIESKDDGKTWKLFDDKNDKLLFSGKTTDSANTVNSLAIGDGSSLIYGAVDLSCFGYTLE